VKVKDQFHIPAALLRGKEPLIFFALGGLQRNIPAHTEIERPNYVHGGTTPAFAWKD
jgi:hypothetical protein